MALRHAAALAAAFILCAGAPALAQNAPINNAPITNVPNLVIPDALPDLVVTKADATLTCVGGNQVIATIAMTIVNKGPKVSADMSKMLVAYEARWHATSGGDALAGPITAIKPSGGIGKPLKPGQSYSNSMVIQGIPEYKKTLRGGSWAEDWEGPTCLLIYGVVAVAATRRQRVRYRLRGADTETPASSRSSRHLSCFENFSPSAQISSMSAVSPANCWRKVTVHGFG